jgi:hypothetical protein
MAIHDSVGITIKIEGVRKLMATVKPPCLYLFQNIVENYSGEKGKN